MKNQVIAWDSLLGNALIEDYFIHMCGLHKDKAALQKKKAYAMQCLKNVLEQSVIYTLVSSYNASCISGREIRIADQIFVCPALDTVSPENVIALYTFALTCGDTKAPDSRVLQQAYYDISGTAIADAARDLLQHWIWKQYEAEKYIVSDAFGPGFYGMPATDVEKFFQFMDCERIHLSLMPSGFMLPAKSCVGFFLVTKTAADLPALDCAHCLGHGKTCNYCKAGRMYLNDK